MSDITNMEIKLNYKNPNDGLKYYIYSKKYIEGKIVNNILNGTLSDISNLYEGMNIIYHLPKINKGCLASPLSIYLPENNKQLPIIYNNTEAVKYIEKNKILSLTYTKTEWILNNIYDSPITTNKYKIVFGDKSDDVNQFLDGTLKEINNEESIYYVVNHETIDEIIIRLLEKELPLFYNHQKYNKIIKNGTILFITYNTQYRYNNENVEGWVLENYYEVDTNPLSYYLQASDLLMFDNVNKQNVYTLNFIPKENVTYNIITLEENNNNTCMQLYLEKTNKFTEQIPCVLDDELIYNKFEDDYDIPFTYKNNKWVVDLSNKINDNFDDYNQFFGTFELEVTDMASLYSYVYQNDNKQHKVGHTLHYLYLTTAKNTQKNIFHLTCDCNLFPESVFFNTIEKNYVYGKGYEIDEKGQRIEVADGKIKIDLNYSNKLSLNFDLNPTNWVYIRRKPSGSNNKSEYILITEYTPKGSIISLSFTYTLNKELHVSIGGAIILPSMYEEVFTGSPTSSSQITLNFDLYPNDELFVWTEQYSQREVIKLENKLLIGEKITLPNTMTYEMGKNQLQISYGGMIVDPSRYNEISENTISFKFSIKAKVELYIVKLSSSIYYLKQPNVAKNEEILLGDMYYNIGNVTYTYIEDETKNIKNIMNELDELFVSYDGIVVSTRKYNEINPIFYVKERHTQNQYINTKDYSICFSNNLFLEDSNKQQIDNFLSLVYQRNKLYNEKKYTYNISTTFYDFKEEFYKKLLDSDVYQNILKKLKTEQDVEVISNKLPSWKQNTSIIINGGVSSTATSEWSGYLAMLSENQTVNYKLNHESNGEVVIKLCDTSLPLYYQETSIEKYNSYVPSGSVIIMTYHTNIPYNNQICSGWWLEEIKK